MSSKFSKNGFTLLEVMLSLSIVVVILTMSTINYKRSNSRNAIVFGTYQLAADLRLAQSYAASARQYSTQPEWNVWGLYLSAGANQYRVFVDLNANGRYDVGSDAIWRTVRLPANVNIKQLHYKKNGSAWSGLSDISSVYFPPAPTSSLAFDASLNQFDEAKITLEDNINFTTKEISLNFFGLIDVTK
jgi:prepilin-type N-terminal cleavage/methylation domain-containing protein